MAKALMIAMVTVGGEREPSPPLVFSASKEVLVAVGADVPEIMNWYAGRLGPSLV
jgi:hypothetical protein